MLRPCWIKPDGEMIPCPNWGDHVHYAHAELGDETDEEIETYACRKGWLKVFSLINGIAFVGQKFTRQQREVVERFGHVADDIEEDAISYWRYMESARRRR